MENSDILLVKNYQSNSTIKEMYQNAFGKTSNTINIMPLTGGLKNAVYLIESNNTKVVLKIGPKDNTRTVSLDRNTMWWEAKVLKLMEEIDIPTPRLLYFDDSCEICSSPYIFMSYVTGKNLASCKSELSKEEISNIEYALGQISYKISSIKNNEFFLPCQPTRKFSNNYEFVRNLFTSLIKDAMDKNLLLDSNNYEGILKIIDDNKNILNDINSISLSHIDLWDGNILIDKGDVTGVLDFSDLYFCDELMTFYFHSSTETTSEYYLKGFHNKVLNNKELIRIQIYKLYTLLKMIVDVEFKGYGKYEWMYQKLDNELKKIKKISRL